MTKTYKRLLNESGWFRRKPRGNPTLARIALEHHVHDEAGNVLHSFTGDKVDEAHQMAKNISGRGEGVIYVHTELKGAPGDANIPVRSTEYENGKYKTHMDYNTLKENHEIDESVWRYITPAIHAAGAGLVGTAAGGVAGLMGGTVAGLMTGPHGLPFVQGASAMTGALAGGVNFGIAGWKSGKKIGLGRDKDNAWKKYQTALRKKAAPEVTDKLETQYKKLKTDYGNAIVDYNKYLATEENLNEDGAAGIHKAKEVIARTKGTASGFFGRTEEDASNDTHHKTIMKWYRHPRKTSRDEVLHSAVVITHRGASLSENSEIDESVWRHVDPYFLAPAVAYSGAVAGAVAGGIGGAMIGAVATPATGIGGIGVGAATGAVASGLYHAVKGAEYGWKSGKFSGWKRDANNAYRKLDRAEKRGASQEKIDRLRTHYNNMNAGLNKARDNRDAMGLDEGTQWTHLTKVQDAIKEGYFKLGLAKPVMKDIDTPTSIITTISWHQKGAFGDPQDEPLHVHHIETPFVLKEGLFKTTTTTSEKEHKEFDNFHAALPHGLCADKDSHQRIGHAVQRAGWDKAKSRRASSYYADKAKQTTGREQREYKDHSHVQNNLGRERSSTPEPEERKSYNQLIAELYIPDSKRNPPTIREPYWYSVHTDKHKAKHDEGAKKKIDHAKEHGNYEKHEDNDTDDEHVTTIYHKDGKSSEHRTKKHTKQVQAYRTVANPHYFDDRPKYTMRNGTDSLEEELNDLTRVHNRIGTGAHINESVWRHFTPVISSIGAGLSGGAVGGIAAGAAGHLIGGPLGGSVGFVGGGLSGLAYGAKEGYLMGKFSGWRQDLDNATKKFKTAKANKNTPKEKLAKLKAHMDKMDAGYRNASHHAATGKLFEQETGKTYNQLITELRIPNNGEETLDERKSLIWAGIKGGINKGGRWGARGALAGAVPELAPMILNPHGFWWYGMSGNPPAITPEMRLGLSAGAGALGLALGTGVGAYEGVKKASLENKQEKLTRGSQVNIRIGTTKKDRERFGDQLQTDKNGYSNHTGVVVRHDAEKLTTFVKSDITGKTHEVKTKDIK